MNVNYIKLYSRERPLEHMDYNLQKKKHDIKALQDLNCSNFLKWHPKQF